MPKPKTRAEKSERALWLAEKRARAVEAVQRAKARDRAARQEVAEWVSSQPDADRAAAIKERLNDPSLTRRGRTAERRALEEALEDALNQPSDQHS